MSPEDRRPLHLPVPLQRFPPPARRRRPSGRVRRRRLLLRGTLMLLAGAATLATLGIAARQVDVLSLLRQAGGAVIVGFVGLLPRLLELGLLLGLMLLAPVALLMVVGGVARIGRALRGGKSR